MFIEGDYNIYDYYANLNLYGKYDKEAPKGVKIVFIPLNWVLKAVFRPEKTMDLYKEKLEQIPKIDAKNIKYFRVNISGKIKDAKPKIELKGIR